MMTINSYNPVDMSLLATGTTGVDFGNVVRGGYTNAPTVIKPIWDGVGGTLTNLFFFLEDNASLNGTQFRVLKSSTPIPGIGSGDARLNTNLTELPGVSDFSNYSEITGDGVIMNATTPEYIWADMKVGLSDTIGSSSINYRFIFEFV